MVTSAPMRYFPTKKGVLFFSTVLFLIFVTMNILQEHCLNTGQTACDNQTWNNVWTTIELLVVSIPLFISSVICTFLKDAVFRSWLYFSLCSIPFFILLEILAPEYGGQGIVSIDRGAVSFALSGLYFIISLILITYKSWKLRGT